MPRLTNSSALVLGACSILGSLGAPARAQSVTIDAFVHLNGRDIPAICLIARVPPKDLCGEILQGVTAAQLQSAREGLERKIEQQSRPLLQPSK